RRPALAPLLGREEDRRRRDARAEELGLAVLRGRLEGAVDRGRGVFRVAAAVAQLRALEPLVGDRRPAFATEPRAAGDEGDGQHREKRGSHAAKLRVRSWESRFRYG